VVEHIDRAADTLNVAAGVAPPGHGAEDLEVVVDIDRAVHDED
jgi:hypothetical protein